MVIDEKAVQPSSDTAAGVQPAQDTPQINPDVAAMAERLGIKFDTVKAASTGEKKDDTPPAAPEGTPPVTEEQPPVQQEEQVVPYTAEEIKATDIDKLDYKRLPPELVPYYNSIRAAQTKKDQDLAEQKKLLKEMVADLKQPTPPPAKPQPQLAPAQEFAARHNFLKNQVEQAFNEQPGSLDPDPQYWTPEQRLAYDSLKTQLVRLEDKKAQEAETAKFAKAKFEAFTAELETELQAADPQAFDYAINKLEKGEVLEKDKKAILAAITNGDKKTVAAYFEQFRREFRKIPPDNPAKTKEPVPVPPTLETAGQGVTQTPKPKFKASDYRNADREGRVRIMKELGMLD